MVSSALASQFAKAGVQTIDPAAGQKIFISELLFGNKQDAEVVWGGPIFHSAETPLAPEARRAGGITSRYPLLAAHAEFHQNADRSLLVVRETTPAVDLYLEHHKLDGKPVLPMAMVLEMFAEVAAAANPGKHVGQIRDLKMLRGVVFDEHSPQILRIEASAPWAIVDLKLETGAGRGFHMRPRQGSQAPTRSTPRLETRKRPARRLLQ
jgi:hypothetical protein